MFSQENFLKINPLFKECLDALGVSMLEFQESKLLFKLFKRFVPLTYWGKVNWEIIEHKIDAGYNPQAIIPALEKLLPKPVDTQICILWNDGGIPLIKADLVKVVEHFDDVTCVAFEKFFFNLDAGYIIEVLPSYQTTVGLLPTLKAAHAS